MDGFCSPRISGFARELRQKKLHGFGLNKYFRLIFCKKCVDGEAKKAGKSMGSILTSNLPEKEGK